MKKQHLEQLRQYFPMRSTEAFKKRLKLLGWCPAQEREGMGITEKKKQSKVLSAPIPPVSPSPRRQLEEEYGVGRKMKSFCARQTSCGSTGC